jgi:hypothetical protein
MSKVGFDSAALPADFKAAAEAIKSDGSDTVGQLIEASKLRKCDFEIAWEQGVAVLLPHLGSMRSDARLLRVNARRLEIAGDADAAAERLAAMIRMARHASNDDILISSLVGAAICSLAIDETEAALSAAKLTPSARQTILAAISTLDRDDPFAMKPAIRGEQRSTLGWIKTTFRGPDAGKKLVATGYLELSEPSNAPAAKSSQIRAAIQAIGQMNEKQLDAAVDLASPYYDQALAAWDKPDAVEQLKALGERIEKGEFGPIGQVFAPAASKARQSALKSENRIAAIKQKLAAPQ